MFGQKFDDGFRGGVVLGSQPELFEDGILADEVGDRVFENRHDLAQVGGTWLGLDVLDDVELDAELTGDGERIGAGVSIRVVEDGDVSHGPP